jgi:hypothetical protein
VWDKGPTLVLSVGINTKHCKYQQTQKEG